MIGSGGFEPVKPHFPHHPGLEPGSFGVQPECQQVPAQGRDGAKDLLNFSFSPHSTLASSTSRYDGEMDQTSLPLVLVTLPWHYF